MKIKASLVFLLAIFLLSTLRSNGSQTNDGIEGVEEKLNQKGSHLDIVFVIDSTGSMGPYISHTRKVIESTMKRFIERGQNIKFGIVAYRDYPPQEEEFITKISDLNNYQETVDFLNKLSAQGGGDSPEAVLTGLIDAVRKISWRNLVTNNDEEKYKKVIFHVADAPPHGRDFSDSYDFFPQGEPGEGVSLDILSEKLNQENIIYYFCKLNESTTKTIEKFMEKIKVMNVIDVSDKNIDSEKARKEFSKYGEWSDSEGFEGGFEESLERRGVHKMKSMIYEASVSNSLLDL